MLTSPATRSGAPDRGECKDDVAGRRPPLSSSDGRSYSTGKTPDGSKPEARHEGLGAQVVMATTRTVASRSISGSRDEESLTVDVKGYATGKSVD